MGITPQGDHLVSVPSVGVRLSPPLDVRLGRPLPYQPADIAQAFPKAHKKLISAFLLRDIVY